MNRRPRLRSVRTKLALVFFAIIVAAFGLLYFIATPQLESKLEQRQLDDLRSSAQDVRPRLKAWVNTDQLKEKELNENVRTIGEVTDARVTLLGVDKQGLFYAQSDSRTDKNAPFNSGLAREAVEMEARAHRDRSARRRGAGSGGAAVLRRPQEAQADRGRLLHARPQRRSGGGRPRAQPRAGGDRRGARPGDGRRVPGRPGAGPTRSAGSSLAAHEVAHGRFIGPLPVDSKDEIGQLTRTFNQMQAQLQQVDVARKEFIATASHELRTPIFSLAGFVELLQDEELDEETRREFLETMAEQVERLQKLSVDLLDLSRLDAGSVELTPSPSTSPSWPAASSTSSPRRWPTTTPTWRSSCRITGLEALCDPVRVAQIMRILLDNALRHTPSGTHVTVGAARNNGTAGLIVTDTGPGPPPARAS